MLLKSTAQSIFQDIQSLFDIYQHELAQFLNSRLKKIGASLSDDLILQQFNSTDSVFQIVQNKFSTEHLFNKYLCDNFNLNSPVEKLISVPGQAPDRGVVAKSFANNTLMSSGGVGYGNTKFVKVQYVPILTTLKNYLKQPDVWASCQQRNVPSEVLHNFTDGKIQTSLSASGQSNFIRIHLYSDQVEICNPFGSRKLCTKQQCSTF